jgi:hypothetical protein
MIPLNYIRNLLSNLEISAGADIECTLEDVTNPSAPNSAKQQHVPVAIALKVTSHRFPDMNLPIRYHFGKDCIEWFFDQLDEILIMATPHLNRIVPMEKMTAFRKRSLYREQTCYLCKEPITGKRDIDHCHFTGII